jgi:hypothetical protein
MTIQRIRKNMKRYLLIVTMIVLSNTANAEDCSTYPLTDGLSVEATSSGGTKFMSTATATVLIDDTDEVIDALREAELYAKANISNFLNETIQNDQSLTKAVNTSVKIVGDQKEITKEMVKTQLVSIRNSSQSLLKGVLKLGECYTKGEFVRVTVGLKPETIAMAAMTEESINQASTVSSASETASNASDVNSSSTGNLNQTKSFSNSSNLSDF